MAADAIIFIPGIKGTKLVETNLPTWDTIWSGLQSNFESIEDLELTTAFDGEYYDERIKSLIKPGEIETLAYGEFLYDLGRISNKPVYIFSYDWRLSATSNGERLGMFLDYLTAKSAAVHGKGKAFSKFDFITHSLGNFVLRAYLAGDTKGRMKRVNRVVFTVPPFFGSLDIVTAALIGEGWFPNVRGKIRKLIRVMPGALELLPSYDEASVFKPKAAHSFFKFEDWQGNVTKRSAAATKMKKALGHASSTVSQSLLDPRTLSPSQRKKILVIARDGYETLQSVTVQKRSKDGTTNFVDFDNACKTEDGDGRVPHISSCAFHEELLTLLVDDAIWFREYSHGFVLKDERVQKLVNRFLFKPSRFNWKIPGGSIRRVTKLTRRVHPETRLPYWRPQ